MQFKKIIFILFCSFLLLSCSKNDAVIHDMKGRVISLSQLKGKWIIINYWAAWCDNCLKEMPELNRFYQNNQDKNILLYGYNFDQLTGEDLKQAADKANIQFPVLIENPEQIWKLDPVGVLPVTFIINPKGEVAKKIMGPSTEQSLITTLRTLQQ